MTDEPDCCTDARDADPWKPWTWHDHHIRSLDGDGEPLHYCAVCFQDWPCVGAEA